MNKDNKEKEWKATSTIDNEFNLDIDADISNLNDDESFVPLEEEEKKPLTEEEKKDIRKKLSFLLVMVFIVLIGLVIVLFFNPFESKEKSNTSNEEVTEKENDEDKSITELNDGDISLNNKEIQILTSEIIYKQYDYYENDTLSLYKIDNTYINNISDKEKLSLVAKTSDFTSLMNNKITTNDVCKIMINISKNEIDEIVSSRLNTSLTTYEPFTYNLYDEGVYNRTIRFVYENDTYTGTCYAPNEYVGTSTQQSVVSATKNKKQLYIDVQVVFVNETGIYKDPNFTTLITDQNQSFEEYIKQGNTYRYTYDISGTAYSLTNVSLLK